jgi:plastocyanin
MRANLLIGSALAVTCAVALWSCGSTTATAPSGTTTPATPSTPATTSIAIVGSSGNTAFSPDVVTASAGDMLVWKNNTTVLHHIVLDDGSVVGDIQPGGSSSPLALKTASGNFHCTIHSTMIGSINTTAPPAAPPCTTPGYC